MVSNSLSSADNSVLVVRDGAVAIIAINRPQRRNALTTAVKDALVDALSDVANDANVRAVVLTGEGGHFCAGQDLGEHAALLSESPELAFSTVDDHYTPIVNRLATMPKPVIAAVEGTCVGAGLGFALACDLRVVGSTATFATAFSAIGLTFDSGLSHSLPRSVGEARARQLILLSETFTPEQADSWGIALRLVEAGAARATAVELAARLAAGPTAAFAQSKRLIAQTADATLVDSLAAESVAQLEAGRTADHAAAVQAFLNKQKPVFVGR